MPTMRPRLVREELEKLRSPQFLAGEHLPVAVDNVGLENRLGDVGCDGDLMHGALSSWLATYNATVGADAVHTISSERSAGSSPSTRTYRDR